MRFKKPCLRLALDEGVPDSVGRAFVAAGHHAAYFNKGLHLPRGSNDAAVCATALLMGRILVAFDGDMREIAKKSGVTRSAYSKLSLLKLSCPEPDAAARVQSCMTLLEHEWYIGKGKERRFFVEIMATVIRSNR